MSEPLCPSPLSWPIQALPKQFLLQMGKPKPREGKDFSEVTQQASTALPLAPPCQPPGDLTIRACVPSRSSNSIKSAKSNSCGGRNASCLSSSSVDAEPRPGEVPVPAPQAYTRVSTPGQRNQRKGTWVGGEGQPVGREGTAHHPQWCHCHPLLSYPDPSGVAAGWCPSDGPSSSPPSLSGARGTVSLGSGLGS